MTKQTTDSSVVNVHTWDEAFLTRLGGKAVYEEGKELWRSGAVQDVEWHTPIARGTVKHGASTYYPRVNLQNITFVANQCNCMRGSRGEICPHALAICCTVAFGQPDLTPSKINLAITLPPNLEDAFPRGAILLHIRCFEQDKPIPIETVNPNNDGVKPIIRDAILRLFQCRERQLGEFWNLNQEQLITLWQLLKHERIFLDAKEQVLLPNTSEWHHIHRLLIGKESPNAKRSDLTTQKPVLDGSLNALALRFPSKYFTHYNLVLETAKDAGFLLDPNSQIWWLRDANKILNFIGEFLKYYEKTEYIELTKVLKDKLRSIKWAKCVGNIDTFDKDVFTLHLALTAGDTPENTIRHALSLNQYFVKHGQHVYLFDGQLIRKLTDLQQHLSGQQDLPCQAHYHCRVHTSQIAHVEPLLETIGAEIPRPIAWQKRCLALYDVTALPPAPIVDELNARLRPYQRLGVAWLWDLYNQKLGGILADEMGLGKTVQALALIQCVVKKEKAAALVVCPASLVENWVREAHNFVPAQRVYCFHGSMRVSNNIDFEQYDLVVTSYATLVRNKAIFQHYAFSVIIGDEAQHIKNDHTQNARALKVLHATGRFLLTGTPIENRFDDLRSLFDFLMPGYIDKIPQGAKRDERDWFDERLKTKTTPYILRRAKIAVAPELPEKLEQTLYCSLEGQQAAMYARLQHQFQEEINKLEFAGVAEHKVRFTVFKQLLRLRQVCADPRIFDPEFPREQIAKWNMLREIIDEARDGGHRILLFSQFVSVLTLLRRDLESMGISYCYLDGQTRERLKECDRFNNDANIPIFLISLKAGGLGLNLTGADTVVHYDPWWNPAAEAQATDRTHRIGQTKVVSCFKLITAQSIEEKVLEMQKHKAHLLKDLLSQSASLHAKLSLQDMKDLLFN